MRDFFNQASLYQHLSPICQCHLHIRLISRSVLHPFVTMRYEPSVTAVRYVLAFKLFTSFLSKNIAHTVFIYGEVKEYNVIEFAYKEEKRILP